MSGEAVAVGSVKCDLAALLCHSGRSGVRGGGAPTREAAGTERERAAPRLRT